MTLPDATATKGSLHYLITEPDQALGPTARLSPRIHRQRARLVLNLLAIMLLTGVG